MDTGIAVYRKLLEVRSRESVAVFESQVRSLSEDDLVGLATAVFAGRLMFEGLVSDPGNMKTRARGAVQRMGTKSKEPIINYLCSLPPTSFTRFFEMVKQFEVTEKTKGK